MCLLLCIAYSRELCSSPNRCPPTVTSTPRLSCRFEENGRVSTLEAVAALLFYLEGDAAVYQGLLDALKVKVDAVRLQKNVPAVYGTMDGSNCPAVKSKFVHRSNGQKSTAVMTADGSGSRT